MSENCLKAQCPKCETTFAIAGLPIGVMEMAKAVEDAACPKCGTDEGLYLDASDTPPDFPLPPSPNQQG